MATFYADPGPVGVSNTTTETTLLFAPPLTAPIIPANQGQPSTMYRFSLKGVYTTIGAPTLRIRVKFSGSTMIFDSAAQTMPLNVSASRIWSLDVLFVIIALGGAGIGTGGGSGLFLYFGSLVTSLLGFEVPPVGGGFDSTVDNTIDVTAQWGTASASNVIQTTSAIIETLTGTS